MDNGAEEYAKQAETKWERPPADSHQVGGAHYQGNFTQQHWDYCWERGFNFFQYVITKYVERYLKKNGLEDLYKARHYLDKLIEVEELARAKAALHAEEAVPAAPPVAQ